MYSILLNTVFPITRVIGYPHQMHYPFYCVIFVTLIFSPSIQARAIFTITSFVKALTVSKHLHLYTNTPFRLSPILHNLQLKCKTIYDLSLRGVTPRRPSPWIPCLKTDTVSQTSWSRRPALYYHQDQKGAIPQPRHPR